VDVSSIDAEVSIAVGNHWIVVQHGTIMGTFTRPQAFGSMSPARVAAGQPIA
jgi:hypothetical protein